MRQLLFLILIAMPVLCFAGEPSFAGKYIRYGRVGLELDICPNGTCTWKVTGCWGKTVSEYTWVEKDEQLLMMEKGAKPDTTGNMPIAMIAKFKKDKVKLISMRVNSKWVLRREHPDVFSEIQYN